MQNDGEMISVLYDCNGWKMSKEAENLYAIRKNINYVCNNSCKYYRSDGTITDSITESSDISFRSDPVLLDIFEELGYAFTYSEHTVHTVQIKKFPKKYKSYCHIIVDGEDETVVIDYDKYNSDCFLEQIKTILQKNDIQDGEKINELKKLVYLIE